MKAEIEAWRDPSDPEKIAIKTEVSAYCALEKALVAQGWNSSNARAQLRQFDGRLAGRAEVREGKLIYEGREVAGPPVTIRSYDQDRLTYREMQVVPGL